jgi:succinoglycan biosynthesis transport protein ExoP
MVDSDEAQQSNIVEKIRGLLRRRRWWVIPTACATALATIWVSYLLPNRYDSEATILVVQQRVPERYVTPTSNTDIKSLDAMTQDVLSRTQLLGIIDELGLYPAERGHLAPEELVGLMRHDLSLKPVQNEGHKDSVDALKIGFSADNPHRAQAVTSRLTALFIQQNLKTREDLANTTTKFLSEQLDSARTKLADQEQRLREFKMQYLGELPEQQQGNLGILSSLQSQLQNTSSNLSRAMQQKLYLQSLLSQYQRFAPGAPELALPGVAAASQIATPLQTAQRELAQLQSEKEQLLALYTPTNPDVQKKQRQIALKQALVDSLKTAAIPKPEEPVAKGKDDKNTPSGKGQDQNESAAVAQLKSQLEANRLEVENLLKSEQQLKESVSKYEARLNLAPVREQQLTGILRDYELLKQHYADLLGKEQQSQLATTLEKQQEGQQFRMVDPPSLPVIPSSPKRLKISLGGLAGGILLGLALAFLVEKSKAAFYEEKAMIRRFALPLVIGIPELTTRSEQRMRKFIGVVEWLCASVLVLVVIAAEFYVFRRG